MKIRFYLLLFSLTLTYSVSAQHFADDVQVKRERTFTGPALYGFMNGGSELFLEYGFQELKVFDVVYRQEEYTIEIYQMPSPTDAFGIYSVNTFKCLRSDSLCAYECLSKYQIQSAVGNYYISIVFQSGSAIARQNAAILLQQCTRSQDTISLKIPAQLGFLKPPYSGNLKYARGPLGTFAINPDLSPMLNKSENYEVWYAGRTEKGICLLLLFSKEEERDMLLKNVPADKIIETGKEFILLCGIDL